MRAAALLVLLTSATAYAQSWDIKVPERVELTAGTSGSLSIALVVDRGMTISKDAGIRSYYLLELTGLARGVLLVAHTDAAPRGFTLLCRRLGARVAEVGSTVLGLGITREWTAAESARLQSEFAALEG